MKRILKFGCGGLIGLFVLLMLIGTLAGGNNRAQPEPTATIAQVAKVQPVAETKPTATVITINTPSPLPAKPTAIAPTSTPSPIATPLPMNTASTATVPTATPVPSGLLTEAKVVRVIDGDTIEVDIQGKKYTVRYIGVNTPETVDPRRPVQYYGKEASAKNKELVEGKPVRLEKDVSETDRYGRLLRYVYVGDTMINAELVRLGYAQSSAYPPDVTYQERFRQLEREAREAGRGLWAAAPDPTPAQANTSAPTATPKLQTQPITQDGSGSAPCQPEQIKGNRNSKIYHAPGQRDYAKTSANVQCFDTEAQAVAAGYRKAQR